MKKTLLATMLLGGMLLCGCDSLIASSSQDSSEYSAPTTIEDSASYSDKALEVKPLGDAAAPTFDLSTKTYSFEVTENDISYELSGAFEGTFAINNTAELEEHGRVLFLLNGVNLTNMATEGVVFSYNSKKSSLVLQANDGTVNKIAADGIPVSCNNDLHLCGNGSLTLSSKVDHAAKADDIRVYDRLALKVNGSGKDGLHGDNFFTDNGKDGGEKVNFSGTIDIKNAGKQAFDFSDSSSWDGSITIGTGTTITIDGCENAFKTDTNLIIDGCVTGIHIDNDPICKDKNYSGTVNAVISGFVSFNGATLAKGSYTY